MTTAPDVPDIDPTVPPSGTGCLECDADGGWWVHLRRCTACGHIGCCDSSPNRHATQHHRTSGHPVITSFEPDEDWLYDYRTDDMVELADDVELAPPTGHPVDQPVPGPAGRVPDDWQSQVG